MQVVFANVTDQQKRWINDAFALCGYPFHLLSTTVTISTVEGVTNCSVPHTYMCTTANDAAHQTIQIESFADDPTSPENAGLPDPSRDLHEFFVDSFVHELGHIVENATLTTGALQQQAAQCFTHIPDGRRGTTADFDGGEGSIAAWGDRMQEGIAEWFRLTFLPEAQVYWNRTNWDLSPADFTTLMKILMPNYWQFGDPITINATKVTDDAEGDYFYDTLDVARPLGRLAWIQGNAFGGTPVLNAPDFDAGGGLPTLHTSQIFQPSLFGSGPRWLALGSAAGLFSDSHGPIDVTDQTGDDVLVFNQGDFATVRMFDPSLEPGYHAHFGYPGVDLGDPKSWSGWRVRRMIQYTLDYSSIARSAKEQGSQGWGMVQVLEAGSIVHDTTGGGTRQRTVGAGFHGPLPSGRDGGDSGAPWGSDPAIIRAPQSGALGPNLVPTTPAAGGWYAGVVQTTQTFFTVATILGSFTGWDGVSGQVVVPPASPLPSQPPAPPGMGSSGSSTPTPTSLAFLVTKSWVIASIEDLTRSYVFPCQPDRIKDEIGFYWQGFAETVDTYSTTDLTFLYWPVKFVTTPLPSYPARFPGFAQPGPVHAGSVRGPTAPELARRQLQVVHRVGGGHRSEANNTTDQQP